MNQECNKVCTENGFISNEKGVRQNNCGGRDMPGVLTCILLCLSVFQNYYLSHHNLTGSKF